MDDALERDVNSIVYNNLHANLHPFYLAPETASYYLSGYWQGLDSHQATVSLANIRPGESVLDVACGPGCVGLLACEQLGSARDVYFTDYSQSLLDIAIREVRRRHPDSVRDHFITGDIREDRTINALLAVKPGGFDVIFVHLFLTHFTEASRPTFLRHLKRLLSPNGRLVVQSEVASDSRAYGGGQPSDSMVLGVREVDVGDGWGNIRNWSMAYRLPIRQFTTLVTTGDRQRGRTALEHIITAAGLTPGACVEAYNRQGSINRSNQVIARAREDPYPPGEFPTVQQDYARRQEFYALQAAGPQQTGAQGFDMVFSLIVQAWHVRII